VDPKYVKYYRMKKAGLPEGAIIQAMARDNVPVPPDFFAEGGGSVAHAAPSSMSAAPVAGQNKPSVAAAASAGAGGAVRSLACSGWGADPARAWEQAAAAAAAAKPKGPQKPVVKPNVKVRAWRGASWRQTALTPRRQMRGLFWTKIQPDQLDGTLWPELKDDRVKLDIAVLEQKFQAVVRPPWLAWE
jgi:hypothetical protein